MEPLDCIEHADLPRPDIPLLADASACGSSSSGIFALRTDTGNSILLQSRCQTVVTIDADPDRALWRTWESELSGR